ncbi:MAG: hypothetical protein ACLFU1_06350, partial [Alphaproteobacteria bacterium]
MAKAKTAETDSSTGSSPNISPVTKSTANNVLKLSHSEAKSFFLKGESYSSFGLPPYFKFDQILSDIDVERWSQEFGQCVKLLIMTK